MLLEGKSVQAATRCSPVPRAAWGHRPDETRHELGCNDVDKTAGHDGAVGRGRAGGGGAVAVLLALVLLATACGAPVPNVRRVHSGRDRLNELSIWLTGYSWQDNTPPASSVVGEPVLHQEAGGTGTYTDPITVAVPGHEGKMAWPPGTRFYLPTVERYVIVEDSGASGAPPGTDTHLDMWIGGQDGTKAATDACEDAMTGVGVPALLNPRPGLPVIPGPIYVGGRCNIPETARNWGAPAAFWW